MFKSYHSLLLCVFYLSNLIYAQTPGYGNLEVYTREAYLSSIGYFSGSFQLPDNLNEERIDFNGMNFTHQYDLATLGNVNFNDRTELRFMLEGIFKVGAAIGDKNIHDSLQLYPSSNVKYYLLNIDFFTLSITPEFTYIFDDGYAVVAQLGIDLVNFGGSAAILDKGSIAKHTVGVVNIIPLAFRPGVFFDFGRAGVGLGAYINTVNILSYRINMADLYPDGRGFYSLDSFFKRVELQIIFTF